MKTTWGMTDKATVLQKKHLKAIKDQKLNMSRQCNISTKYWGVLTGMSYVRHGEWFFHSVQHC